MYKRIAIFLAVSLAVGLAKLVTTALSMSKLGYRVMLVSHKGREAELISGVICLAMWIVFFIFDLSSNTVTMIDPVMFTMLLGGMCGICISTVYTLLFMPRGFYEKGILSETKAVTYKEIARHKTNNTVNKKYVRFSFPLMLEKKGKNVHLFVPLDQKDEAEQILKQHHK